MNRQFPRPISVCTWSLQNDLVSLAQVLETIGSNHIHLAIAAIMGEAGSAFREAIVQSNWSVTSTMTGFPQEDYSTLQTIR